MNNKKAFTLIEMMLTIGIIVILSSVLTSSVSSYVGKAQSASLGVESRQNKYEAAKSSVNALSGVTAAPEEVVVVPVTYTVIFNYKDSAGLAASITRTVSSGGTATLPDSSAYAGYAGSTFSKWIGTYTNVTSNQTVNAEYITAAVSTYTVTFNYKDSTGAAAPANVQNVTSGGSATPPPTTGYAGYTFDSWDGIYTNITSNQTVNAVYKAIPSAPVPVPNTKFVIQSGWSGYTYACKATIPKWTVSTYVTITLPAGAVAAAWYQCTIVSQTNGVVVVKVSDNNTGLAFQKVASSKKSDPSCDE